MRHGIGTKTQQAVLLAAGVKRLWTPGEAVDLLPDKQIAPLAFRPADTIVMVQPDLLTAAEMRKLARLTPLFEVIGHAPINCESPSNLTRLRGLRPMVESVVEKKKGPNTKYAQPTLAQLHVIVGYWHGSMKQGEYMPLIREMMAEPDLPQTVVRDWVTKHTGSVKRDADAPEKRPLPPLEQDD